MTYYAPLVTLVLTFILMTGKTGIIVRDIPNERSLHNTPVPRVGGIALMAGVLSGWALLMQFLPWWIVLPAAGLFALSLLDDMRSLSARTRLIVHFIAALAAVSGAGVPLLWLILVLLFIVWMTNLYNFMDGSDGLGASQYRARGIRVDAVGRRIGRVKYRPGCAGTGRHTGLLVCDLFWVINLARSGLAVVPDKTGEY